MAEFDEVMRLYDKDFDRELLKSQLEMLKTDCSEPVLLSVVHKFLTDLGESRTLLSQVVKLLGLMLVMQATNATSERSFSALKRVENISPKLHEATTSCFYTFIRTLRMAWI